MGEEQDNLRTTGGPSRIGPTLEKTRHDLGLSHEEVEEATRIRQRYLLALERDNYDALPGAVYAQGFLRTYADYLGLDGSAFVRELKERRETPRPPVISDDRSERAVRAEQRDLSRRPLFWRRVSPAPLIGSAVVLLIVGLMIGGLYYVGQRVIQSSTSAPQEEVPADARRPEGPEAQGAREPAEPPAETPPAEAPVENEEPGAGDMPDAGDAPSSPEKLRLEVQVEDNISWLNVRTDGDVAYEQVAHPGFTRTFEAEEEILIWSGNAGAVRIEVNGQDYGTLGNSGEVKTRNFTLKAAES